jgi:hypothetical protein
VAIDVLAPLKHPQYHSYAYRMVSELFAVGAPTRSLLGPPMIAYNFLVFAFVSGVWRVAGQRRTLRSLAVALGVYATISTLGYFVTPMDVRSPAGVTERDVLHIGATVVQGLALLAALGLGAFALGPRFRVYSVVTFVTSLAFGALAGVFARGDFVTVARDHGARQHLRMDALGFGIGACAVEGEQPARPPQREPPSESVSQVPAATIDAFEAARKARVARADDRRGFSR